MYALYLASVFLHVLAAIVWVGGMSFVTLVVVPWLRRGGRAQAGTFLRETGVRFRFVGWICFAVLVTTGTFNLWFRGVRIADVVSGEWASSPFGRTVLLKVGLFGVALGVSAVHDFVVGPRASSAIAADPTSVQTERLRRAASLLGRSNMILAIVIVALAVMLVRGTPW